MYCGKPLRTLDRFAGKDRAVKLSIALSLIFVYAFGAGVAQASPTTAGRSCNFPKDELTCMACNIYFEARGEPDAGMVAVGKTVMTRAASPLYPKTLCGVVYERQGAWQYSWVGGINHRPSSPRRSKHRHARHQAPRQSYRLPKDGIILARVEKAARTAMAQGPSGATRYYADYIPHPRDLSRDCHMVNHIGHHLFFWCPEIISPTQLLMAQFQDSRRYGHVANPRISAMHLPLPPVRPGHPVEVAVAEPVAQPVAKLMVSVRRPRSTPITIDDERAELTPDTAR